MLEIVEDRSPIEVWVAMADHFLDTETRQDIPLTAMRCVEAGLSPMEARQVWQHEVSPAVGFNLWVVAGEWAYWDRDWLGTVDPSEAEKIRSLYPEPFVYTMEPVLSAAEARLGDARVRAAFQKAEPCPQT